MANQNTEVEQENQAPSVWCHFLVKGQTLT